MPPGEPKRQKSIRISDAGRAQLRELCALTGNSEGVAIERAIAAALVVERELDAARRGARSGRADGARSEDR